MLAQKAKTARRCNENQFIDARVACERDKLLAKMGDEGFLCPVMPVRLLDCASSAAFRLINSALTVRSEFARPRLIFRFDLDWNEIDELCVALVTQDQRFGSITHQHHAATRNSYRRHDVGLNRKHS